MTTATKKKAVGAAVSAPPANGIPSQIAYLTRVLKTPTIGRMREELAEHARDENWSHEEYLAAVLGRNSPIVSRRARSCGSARRTSRQ